MAQPIQSYKCLDGTIAEDKTEALRRDGVYLAQELLAAGAVPATADKKVEAIRQKLLELRVPLTELFEDTIASAIGDEDDGKVRRLKR